jgi:NADP-reducing hydrogenase subunit HndB
VRDLSGLNPEKLQALHRDLRDRPKPKVRVIVHMGTCGIASGSEQVLEAVLQVANDMGQSGIEITTSGCAGLCSREPMMTVEITGAPPVKYCDIDPVKARKIYSEHVLGGTPVGEYALGTGCESLY